MNLSTTPLAGDRALAHPSDYRLSLRNAAHCSLQERRHFWGSVFLSALGIDAYLLLTGVHSWGGWAWFQLIIYALTLVRKAIACHDENVARFACECLVDASVTVPVFFAAASIAAKGPLGLGCQGGALAIGAAAMVWLALNALRPRSQSYKVLFAKAFRPATYVPSARQRYETCVHEAAHALMFALRPSSERKIELFVPWLSFGNAQGALFWNSPPRPMPSSTEFLVWDIAMSAAGGLAERELLHREPCGCEGDRNRVRLSAALLAQRYGQAASDRIVTEAYALSRAMLHTNSDLVFCLARALFVKGRLNQATISRFLASSRVVPRAAPIDPL